MPLRVESTSVMSPTISSDLLARAAEVTSWPILITGPDIEPPGPTILFVNAAMAALTGFSQSELVGSSPRMLQGPETDREMLRRLKTALRAQESFSGEAYNRRKDRSSYLVEWIIDPIRDDAGNVEGWMSIQRDVTRRRQNQQTQQRTEERLRILVGELQHRTRNLVGLVRALFRRSIQDCGTYESFKDHFGDRLEALARANSLLSRYKEGDRITFDEVIRNQIASLKAPDGTIDLDGPVGIPLRLGTVQTLSLALHELATNAAKYGALAQNGGCLTVQWWCESPPQTAPVLHVRWRETNIGMTKLTYASQEIGFGRELIERALPHQLGATTSFEVDETGIQCTIELPLDSRSF